MYNYNSGKSSVEINSNVKFNSFVLLLVSFRGERLEKLVLNLWSTLQKKNRNTFKHITSMGSELLNASPKVRVFVHAEESFISDCT
jgi:hypothetical protein